MTTYLVLSTHVDEPAPTLDSVHGSYNTALGRSVTLGEAIGIDRMTPPSRGYDAFGQWFLQVASARATPTRVVIHPDGDAAVAILKVDQV